MHLAEQWRIGAEGVERLAATVAGLLLRLFLHRDWLHLTVNLVVLLAIGGRVEAALGPSRTAALLVFCGIAGGLTEFYLADPQFVGLSPSLYGLLAFWLVDNRARRAAIDTALARDRRFRNTCWLIGPPLGAIGLLLAIEVLIEGNDVAIFSHLGGALSGLASALGGKRKSGGQSGPAGSKLRPMTMRDLGPVLDIIEAHDEDDADEAQESITQRQASGMFVLEEDGQIVGVTGAQPDLDAQGIAWLSWTYMHPDVRSQGIGRMMVDEMLAILRANNVRKVFISTSDYKEEGEDVYADARRFYESLGAELELLQRDYHQRGEARYVYGLSVVKEVEQAPAAAGSAPEASSEAISASASSTPPPPPPGRASAGDRTATPSTRSPENPQVAFVGHQRAPESDGGRVIEWRDLANEIPGGEISSAEISSGDLDQGSGDGSTVADEQQSPTAQLQRIISQARSDGIRALYLALPEELSFAVEDVLTAAGFRHDGALRAYYADTESEEHWSLDL